jgi:peroxiredoxin Q/BCP
MVPAIVSLTAPDIVTLSPAANELTCLAWLAARATSWVGDSGPEAPDPLLHPAASSAVAVPAATAAVTFMRGSIDVLPGRVERICQAESRARGAGAGAFPAAPRDPELTRLRSAGGRRRAVPGDCSTIRPGHSEGHRAGQVAGRMSGTVGPFGPAEGARVTDKRLAPGDEAPDFTLDDADGHPVSLSSLRGQRVIVYFYPAAMTPGCTTQACDFRDSLSALAAAGVTVLGISPDPPAKLARFRDKEGLNFPLLSDPGHEVERAYGTYGEKKLYGKTTVGVIRSTFVVGPDGTLEHAYYGVKATGHVARLRKDLGI